MEKTYEEVLEKAKKAYSDYKKGLEEIDDKNSKAAILLTGSISALELQFPELKEESEDKTIEEKARAYDKAYKLAEGIHKFSSNPAEIKRLEQIFPELKVKESDDDRIRKHLIKHFRNKSKEDWNGVPVKSVLSWLEKQAEQIDIANKEYWRGYREGKKEILDKYAELEKQGEQKAFDYENANIQQKDFAPKSAMEAIKEEKVDNANKVEPKFKVGDWIIDKQGIVHQIANVIEIVTNHTYGYDIVGGGYFNDNTEGVRLWNIQDAKDGDVLADGDLPFIFKKIDTNKYCYAYCGISADDGFRIKSEGKLGEWTWMQDIKPATKEQRDTLMKAMTDAGYTFDFEKKELNKIEAEPENYKKQVMSEMTNLVKDYIQHNPAWSEEDEKMLKSIINDLSQNVVPDEEDINWLKSLKERRVQPQPKQEWSEEDSPYYDDICEILINLLHSKTADVNKDAIQKDLDWFISLKGRVQPHPEWNEEDEKRAEGLLGWLDTLVNYIHHDAIVSLDLRRNRMQQVEQFKAWLKSLKNRVQPKKQGWSEEDEEMFDAIIADIQFTQKAHNHEVNQVVYEREIDWLKSIKDKYTWKPSKEQIEALDNARNVKILDLDWLDSLHQDLKKLKEE